MKRERVLMAMSGGVDSSVAAALLVEEGYNVVAATMKLFCHGDSVPDRPCCSLDSITDARLVAHRLGIPHYVLNVGVIRGITQVDVIADTVAVFFNAAGNLGEKWVAVVRHDQTDGVGFLPPQAARHGIRLVAERGNGS